MIFFPDDYFEIFNFCKHFFCTFSVLVPEDEVACKKLTLEKTDNVTGVTMIMTMVFVQSKSPDCLIKSLSSINAPYNSLFLFVS